MERFLSFVDRRLGRHVPGGLGLYLVGLWGMAFALLLFRPEVIGDFTLDRSAIFGGEPWRLITFLLLPPSPPAGRFGIFLGIFAILFFFTVFNTLESEWGPARLWTYYLIGVLGTIGGALLTGSASNAWLNVSLIMAMGTVAPDYEIRVYLILPLKMKWMAILAAILLGYAFVTGSTDTRASIAMALLNYLLFFGAQLVDALRGKARAATKTSFRGAAASITSSNSRLEQFREMSAHPKRRSRICAKCGRSEAEDPTLDFRVCNCEKCGGKPTDYCVEHARAH